MKPGPLIILSGPAGVGKTTVAARLVADSKLPLHQSVSATTRTPRPGERDGVDYHFWTAERFQKEIDAGGFLEWAEVFGRRYGTPRSEVEPYRARGTGVLLVIDVQGAAQVRRACPDAVSVFLTLSAPEMYERRLRKRGADDEASIARRLEAVRRELARSGEYTYQVCNDDLETAVAELRGLIAPLFGKETSCSTT